MLEDLETKEFRCFPRRAVQYGACSSVSLVLGKAIKEVSVCSEGNLRGHTRDRVWNFPPRGFIKLNSDGARNPHLGLASSATVARDDHGRWICGVGRNIGRCNVEQVKLWAIYDVLQLT